MKIRLGFVSNSSSSAFIITNTSKEEKTIVDFAKENPQLLESYNTEYSDNISNEDMIESAENRDLNFSPGESKYCAFGDEEGTSIGKVYDYILRSGGKSLNFIWMFREHLR